MKQVKGVWMTFQVFLLEVDVCEACMCSECGHSLEQKNLLPT